MSRPQSLGIVVALMWTLLVAPVASAQRASATQTLETRYADTDQRGLPGSVEVVGAGTTLQGATAESAYR